MPTLRQRLAASLTPDLGSVVVRFPVPLVAAAIVAILSMLRIEEAFANDELLIRIIYGCVIAFFIATAGQIWGEAQGGPFLPVLGQTVGAALGAGAGLAYFQPWLSVIFSLGAATALLIASPGLGRAATPARFWSMNAHFGFALVFGFAGVSAVVIGLWAVLATLRALFDLPISPRILSHAWTLGFCFVLPVYWLALTPRSDDFEEDETLDNVIVQAAAVLTDVVFVPIALIYAAILHVYAAKIGLEGVLPRGQIGWMASIFLVLGYGAWLLSYQNRGPLPGLRRFFHRFWPPFTVVPAVLLGLAVGERIAAYGITEERILLVMIAGLAATLAVIWLVRRRLDVRIMPIATALVLLGLAVGPFNAERMTERDQARRLVRLLDEAGALQDGRLAVDSNRPRWTDDTYQQAQSVISLLERRKAFDALEPVVSRDALADAAVLKERLGLTAFRPQPTYIFFNGQTARLERGMLLGPFSATAKAERAPLRGSEAERHIMLNDNVLVLTAPEGEFRFDLATLANAPPTIGSDAPPPTLGSGGATLILRSARIEACGAERCIAALDGQILLP